MIILLIKIVVQVLIIFIGGATFQLLPCLEELPTVQPDAAEWNSTIELVHNKLAMFTNLCGGHARATQLDCKIRNPLIMTMVPMLITSSIGAGQAPQAHGSLSNPARYDLSRSSAALWEGKFQIHPDMKSDDPILLKWGGHGLPSSHFPMDMSFMRA
ncbi:hypothetical protein EDC04DRAFT_2604762 [Pisolithus marmoratus]|nr:hypothetical protein EDC04DRAFT_2604762 [Pisolithus marmoratus]